MKYKRTFFRSSPKNIFYTLLVFLAFIFLVYTIIRNVFESEEKIEIREFESACKEIQIRILDRLNAQAQLLRCGAALFAASDSITRNEWSNYYSNSYVEVNLPGITGLGFALYIPKDFRQTLTQRIREEGYPNFKITPESDKDYYSTIIYIEPYEGRNIRGFGFDMLSEENRRKAMEAACDYNQPSLSDKVNVNPDLSARIQPGVLMYVPVYKKNLPSGNIEERRNSLYGWVYSPYKMDDLINGILGSWEIMKKNGVNFTIYDGAIISEETELFRSETDSLAINNITRSYDLTVNFKGKIWTLLFTQTGHEITLRNTNILIAFIAGLIVTLLITLVAFSVVNTKRRAEYIAIQLTSELNERKQLLQAILNSASEGIFGIDNEGRFTFVNDSCLKLLGYQSHSQLIGIKAEEMLQKKDNNTDHNISDNSRFLKYIEQGKIIHSDNEFLKRSDGCVFPVEYWLHPIYVEGLIKGAVVSFFDITERKQNEKELKLAKIEAEIANNAKSEFLLNISHEFRTPINAVIGYAELIESAEGKIKKDYAASIISSGRRLLCMVNDILDLIRFEKADFELNYEFIESFKFFNEFEKSYYNDFLNKGLKFSSLISPALPFYIWIDEKRLRQIIANLLDNAIKYTEKGEVNLIVSCSYASDNFDTFDLIIKIQDTGIGMSPEFQKKMFESFAQEGKKTVLNGVGIGLPLTKSIVNKMNGEISVNSEQGVGSTFIVTLCNISYKKGENKSIIEKENIKNNIKTLIDKQNIIDLKGLISDLEGSFYETFKTLEFRQPIDEVEKFGQDLLDLGKKYNCSFISEYGQRLLDAAINFNIEEMLKLIKQYPDNIKTLKN